MVDDLVKERVSRKMLRWQVAGGARACVGGGGTGPVPYESGGTRCVSNDSADWPVARSPRGLWLTGSRHYHDSQKRACSVVVVWRGQGQRPAGPRDSRHPKTLTPLNRCMNITSVRGVIKTFQDWLWSRYPPRVFSLPLIFFISFKPKVTILVSPPLVALSTHLSDKLFRFKESF